MTEKPPTELLHVYVFVHSNRYLVGAGLTGGSDDSCEGEFESESKPHAQTATKHATMRKRIHPLRRSRGSHGGISGTRRPNRRAYRDWWSSRVRQDRFGRSVGANVRAGPLSTRSCPRFHPATQARCVRRKCANRGQFQVGSGRRGRSRATSPSAPLPVLGRHVGAHGLRGAVTITAESSPGWPP